MSATVRHHQPFDMPGNIASGSIATTWTVMGNAVGVRTGVEIVGVYWSSVTYGATLSIRDTLNNIPWYQFTADGTTPVVDLFQTILPLYAPFEYYDSEGGNVIVIYGRYVRS